MNITRRLSLVFAAALSAAFLAVPAHADLLTGNEAQLEAWLGQGNLDFTNIFTKVAGNTGVDFHTAVDNKGSTFTLISIYGNDILGGIELAPQIIGGYNPQSWTSSMFTNITPNDADRTAFLFNLSNNSIQRQNLVGQGFDDYGRYQASNINSHGPIFGTGFDLYIYEGLDHGFAYNASYGGTSYGQEITSGPPNYLDYSRFNVGSLEVYTFAPATSAVPDSTSIIGLITLSLGGLVMLRRRFAA